jgi:hypothetical protein
MATRLSHTAQMGHRNQLWPDTRLGTGHRGLARRGLVRRDTGTADPPRGCAPSVEGVIVQAGCAGEPARAMASGWPCLNAAPSPWSLCREVLLSPSGTALPLATIGPRGSKVGRHAWAFAIC